jgi:D-alanyl-D-alanine carboxypeptidase
MLTKFIRLFFFVFLTTFLCASANAEEVLTRNLFDLAQRSYQNAFAPEALLAKGLHLRVKSAILMNMNTGEILFEQDADNQIPPASLTKILTLYIIFDDIQNGRLRPWEQVKVSLNADNTFGSTMSLKAGEEVKITEIIKGISIASANDGCVAMAEYLENGDIQAFVKRMNETARSLGMEHTQFFNPNGLPADGQLTTARDILKLSQSYLQRFPKALAIHSQKYYSHNNRTKHNANSLLGKYEGVDGLKTGYVRASGFNIAATAKRGDTRLLAVVLGARNSGIRELETAKLLDTGFRIIEAQRQTRERLAEAVLKPAAQLASSGESLTVSN